MSLAKVLNFETLQEIDSDMQMLQVIQGFQQVLQNIEKTQIKKNKEKEIIKQNSYILVSEKSLYYSYILKAIDDAAEYYNIPKKDVNFSQITIQRKINAKNHFISRKGLYRRIDRLVRINDYRNGCYPSLREKFWNEMEKRVGLSTEQMRAELQIIASNFNEMCKPIELYDAIDLNKDFMQIGIDIVLEWEKELGIYDDVSFKQHVHKLQNKYKHYPYNASNEEYMEWFDQMVVEYQRIFNYKSIDDVIKFIFDYTELELNQKPFSEKRGIPRNYGKKSEIAKFSGDVRLNIHTVLNNETIKNRFYNRISLNVFYMW